MSINTELLKYISQPSFKVKENKLPCTFVNILAPRTTTPTIRYRQTIYKTEHTHTKKKIIPCQNVQTVNLLST